MKDQLSPIMQRTRRWKFEAGTTELILGGIFFWAGSALLLPLLLRRPPTFMLIVFIAGLFFTGILVQYLERRYVYPRIGYVEYRENTGRGIWRLLLMMFASLIILGGILALLFKYQPETALAWVTPLLALYFGAVMVPYALQLKLRRLILLGLISAVIGLALSPIVLGRGRTDGLFGLASLGFYLLAMGPVFLFSGGCTFRAFLLRNPASPETPDEH